MSKLRLEARKLYTESISNNPTVHCNRFPSWEELSNDMKVWWMLEIDRDYCRVCENEGYIILDVMQLKGMKLRFQEYEFFPGVSDCPRCKNERN